MIDKNTTIKLTAVAAVAIIILASIIVVFESQKEEKVEEKEEVIEIDDRISPFLSQGLTVEVLRIRNRGLMDKMLSFGSGWKNPPEYYWVSDVDGEIGDTSVIEAAGGVEGSGTFTEWDTMLKECRVNYKINNENQETSQVKLTIMEIQKTGLLGRKESKVEKEEISLSYDFRTGHWDGDDYLGDNDGYGHFLGEEYEIWFNLYQSDYDHDGIPFWTEVNIYDFDPTIDDSELDPDNDGIPSSWEWKYGYDPTTYDSHNKLDPDVDGIENIEEYKLAEFFSDPYSPDMYLETDGMKKGGFFDWEHIFYEESQQMVIERFAQHGINVYIDDGWPDGPINGGGEMLDFVETLDEVVGGHMSRWYKHNFADERKGVFRYVIVANNAGFITPSEYNNYDHIVIDTSKYKTYVKRFAFTPKRQIIVLAKGVIHELGHSLGLEPWTFYGIDNMPNGNFRWPDTLTDEEWAKYNEQYVSVMNYKYIFDIFKYRNLFDYSNGENGEPYDFDDWGHIYVPAFQRDSEAYEEPTLDTFEDFDRVDKEPEPVYKTWVYDENLTQKYSEEISLLSYDIGNADLDYRIYVESERNDKKVDVRIYTKPLVKPVTTIWSLIGEGQVDMDENTLEFYSYDLQYEAKLEFL